ncbi:MAG: aspartate kinase, partial [Bacteriovoracaceae bacterium]
MKTIVSKFGGSSMADETAMERSAKIAHRQGSSIVLVSATYGTTDQLVELIQTAEYGNWNTCEKILFNIREKHFDICNKVASDQVVCEQLRLLINELETLARGIFLLKECSPKARDQVLSFGERMSSLLFARSFQKLFPETDTRLFDARTVMITDDNHTKAKPLLDAIAQKAKESFEFSPGRIYITQGFIGQTETGSTTTLGRGGSDYSAALLAEAAGADVLEIWTDVAGIASTDPRICKEAKSIQEISYDEASEMAQYGAKILHPTTLVPAMRKSIPVFVGSSYDGNAKGT